MATCACITALYNDCDAVQLIVAGDFNCQVGSRFFNVFKDFVDDNNLTNRKERRHRVTGE